MQIFLSAFDDVSFREDAARNKKDNGPGNIAVLRRRALDVVRRDTSKGSLRIKIKRDGTRHSYAAFSMSCNKHDAKRDCPFGYV
jgi:hypothetical protein